MRGSRSLVVLASVAFVFLLYWGEPFFVPLLVWLVWFGRLRFRARPSRARAILAPRGAGEPAE